MRGLRDVYLERSIVLGLDETPGIVRFRMEFALRETHPAYAAPVPGEQYCYRRGHLIFSGPRSVHWNEPAPEAIADPNGEVGYGNIDVLLETARGTYLVEGDWGNVLITSDPPRVVIASGASAST